MYVQWFVKGIAGETPVDAGITQADADEIVLRGLLSNLWRNKPDGTISTAEIEAVLTDYNLDRHIHDYANYGPETPFISLAAGSVERDESRSRNFVYSAIDTALDFATDSWGRPGALIYGWVLVSLNPAVPLSFVAESVRDLHVYRRWSPWQLEGEITAKVHIPANQIEKVEWWDGNQSRINPVSIRDNLTFLPPAPILNVRDYF